MSDLIVEGANQLNADQGELLDLFSSVGDTSTPGDILSATNECALINNKDSFIVSTCATEKQLSQGILQKFA